MVLPDSIIHNAQKRKRKKKETPDVRHHEFIYLFTLA